MFNLTEDKQIISECLRSLSKYDLAEKVKNENSYGDIQKYINNIYLSVDKRNNYLLEPLIFSGLIYG